MSRLYLILFILGSFSTAFGQNNLKKYLAFAQEQYDKYVEGGGVKKDIPFVITAPEPGIVALAEAAEPPVR